MKVLVAAKTSQGARERDLWLRCVDGELVRMIEEPCQSAAENPGSCSCETAFVGLASHGLTTTATVREVSGLTMRRYRSLVEESLTGFERTFIRPARYADELGRVASRFEEEEVLERWREWIGCRFDAETGRLHPDVASIADLDPDEVEEIARLADDPSAE